MTSYPLNFTAYHYAADIKVNITELNATHVIVTKSWFDGPNGDTATIIQDTETKTDVEDWLQNAPEAFAEV